MPNFITPEGLKEFEKEYQERLKKRKEIGKAIKQAKEQGDLSENAEYSAAKAQQAENERKLNWLRCVIEKAHVVEKKGMKEVNLGCLVELEKEENLKKSRLEVQVVGVHEVDPAKGKISHRSPLGEAIIGKKRGEKIEVKTPNGKEKYEIKDIK